MTTTGYYSIYIVHYTPCGQKLWNRSERYVMDYNQLNIIQLLNLSTQLDKTNLGQLITKQCLILFNLWCKVVTLAIKVKTFKQNIVRSKCLNIFLIQNFTGSPLYEDFLGIIYNSSLYFAIITFWKSFNHFLTIYEL